MTKKQTTIISLLSVVAIILTLMVSSRFWFRLDLTKNKSHTISSVSRNLYKELPDPVNITYYLSDKFRGMLPASGEIEDTLREYAAYSRGKIIISVNDPVKSGLSRTVNELGLQPKQIQTVEKDQASLITVYSGIVIEYLDKTDVIPWIVSTETLEYDLTFRIRSMITDTGRAIGVIVGDNFRQYREDFSYLHMTLTNAGYMIRQIYPGEEIPDNLPALFVLGGAETLDDRALYRIDRYIQLGGKVLFAVKGISVDTAYGTLEARRMEDKGLLDMIASYGVIIRPELVLDRNALAMYYQGMTQFGVQYRILRYPLWIGVLGENGNSSHPVSANFGGLDLFWSSPLELYPIPDVETSVLFTSTVEAWLMREYFYTSPEIPYMMEMEAEETRGTKILGASAAGIFPSFFRGASKPGRESSSQLFENQWYEDQWLAGELADEELPDMPQRASHSRIIVVGDTDFATNIIDVTNGAHNLDFLLRAADWLTSDDDIISIRNRQPQAGRFDKITDIDKRIKVMSFSQILNVGLIPALVIFCGLFLASQRRKRSRSVQIVSVKEKSDDV